MASTTDISQMFGPKFKLTSINARKPGAAGVRL